MIDGLSYNGGSLAYKDLSTKISNKTMSKVARYWALDKVLDLCEDEDVLAEMLEIEDEVTLCTLKVYKEDIRFDVLGRAY